MPNELVIPDASNEEIARFWDKVTRGDPDECWEWTAGCQNGYGSFWYRGQGYRAHRFSYVLHGGIIPEGMVIDHTCINTRCVNPNHLEVVTHAENSHRSDRGRRRKNHCAYGHALTEDNVYIRKDNGRRACRECRRREVTLYQRRKHLREGPLVDWEARTWQEFWAKVERRGDCWIWVGSHNGRGQGYANFGLREARNQYKTVYAHKFLFEARYGKMDPTQRLFNQCGNKHCVNPDHWKIK